MLKRIKHLFKVNSLVIAIIITVAIIVLSLVKIGKQPISFSNIDKVQHAIAYFALTLAWLVALVKKRRQELLVIICCLFLGIIIEYLQGTVTNYRTAEGADILANTTGVVIGLLIFRLFFKK